MPLPPKHHYERDGLPTRKDGPEGCLHCPLPAGHAVHQVEPVPDEVTEAEARKIGERK